MTHYAGVPVGLALQSIPAGASAVLRARIEETLLLTRLRWSVPIAGLVLTGVRIHKDFIGLTSAPFLSLAGDGVWRFPTEVAQVSVEVSIEVTNHSAASIFPHAIAFWGLRWDRLTPHQRWAALGRPGFPPGPLP